MSETIRATVQAISSKKDGIKLNNVWYNAIGKAQEFLTQEKIGKEVEIKLTDVDKREFNYIRLTSANKTNGSKNSKDETILRQFAFKQGLQVVALTLQYGNTQLSSANKLPQINSDNIMTMAQAEAEKIINWVRK